MLPLQQYFFDLRIRRTSNAFGDLQFEVNAVAKQQNEQMPFAVTYPFSRNNVLDRIQTLTFVSPEDKRKLSEWLDGSADFFTVSVQSSFSELSQLGLIDTSERTGWESV